MQIVLNDECVRSIQSKFREFLKHNRCKLKKVREQLVSRTPFIRKAFNPMGDNIKKFPEIIEC